ncbi:DJ-1/PfpI family protein [Hyphobacterium sp.]|uniref:DJ-1/PfpI family protein n=1 Tax=Hyphobacterium sp. TaxID=2004662 RepID=UPI003B51B3A8
MKIGFFVFANMTQLDFTGPLQVLGRAPDADVSVIARSLAPVKTDGALTLLPTHDVTTAPDLDLVCVPGGFGIDAVARDDVSIEFLRRQGAQAQYVTSVCTGALILGAAGLLTGRRATTHWAYHDLLTLFGAEPVKQRVVRDANLFTGGGVTAGIDFALTILGEIAGADYARTVQLGLEYDPHPPWNSGHPDTADPAALAAARKRYATAVAKTRAAFSQAPDKR